MRFFIIAGEASGDLHASNLMKGFLKHRADVTFSFIGGDLMSDVADKSPLAHYREMNFMGLFDVLLNIFRIRRIFQVVRRSLQENPPDAVVLVDYAGFNLKVAALASRMGIKVFYYISPKVWAWRESRVKKLKRYVDKLFVIFPFEQPYFRSHHMAVEYHGNPLADAVSVFQSRKQNREEFLIAHSLDNRPIIALVAGSRKQEITHCFPEMIKAAKNISGMQLVVAGAPSVDADIYREVIGSADVKMVYNDTYQLLSHAYAALVTSGTATLETALFRVPQVVMYKTGGVTYRLGKLFVSFKFFSLVNLILDRELVKEVLQFNLADEAYNALIEILENEAHREKILLGYDEIIEKVGQPGSSERVAGRMLALCD